MIVLPRSRVLWRQLDRFSTGGWLLGLLFFALALTPSLIPRHFTTQGILCGCAFAAGYGIGVFLEWLWDYLELRWPSPRLARWIGRIVALACLILAIAFLWFSTGWQNSIRAVMGVAPVEARQPWFVAAIAVGPAAILIRLGTLLVQGVRLIAAWLTRIIPRRVALAGAILVVGVLAATIGEGVVGRGLLYAADRFYGDFDRLAASQAPAPIDPLRSGSAASLIDWDTIGLDARIYVQSGPSVDEIADVTGRPAIEPLRVYVGLRSAETPEARAELALREMDRVGAFDRSILVLIMPVGTGWVEPAAIDTLEFLHGGDVASVAVQYSYLTSWLSLVSEPDVGVETARSLFGAVYARWSDMPEDARPRLYLHGLSLGAYSSAASSSLYDILADPFDGALWVGPPFATATWLSATINREPGSPWWLPSVGDGSVVAFPMAMATFAPMHGPGGRCARSFCNIPAIRSSSSSPPCCGASRSGSADRGPKACRTCSTGIRWSPSSSSCSTWRWPRPPLSALAMSMPRRIISTPGSRSPSRPAGSGPVSTACASAWPVMASAA